MTHNVQRVKPRQVLALSAMIAGMFIALTNIQIVGSSYQEIQGGLAAGPDEISWVLTAALIAEVIMIPLSGWLSRLMSTRILFSGCIFGFSMASLGCGHAWNIESIIVFRALQGFFGGAMMPMVFAAVYTIFPRDRQTLIMTVVSFIGVLTVAIGPSVGGILTEALSWRWMFWASVPVGLVVMVVVVLLVDFDRPDWTLMRHIDYPGIALAALFLGSLLIVLEEGRREDWFESKFIIGLSAVSAISGYLFIWRELTCRHPVVDLSVFLNRDFAIGCFYICVYGIVYYVPIFLLPLYLARVRAIDSMQIGIIVAVLGLSMAVSAPIAGLMLKFFQHRVVALLGFLCLALGTWQLGHLNADYGFAELAPPQAIRGLATQLCWLSSVTLAMSAMPLDRIKNASALFNLTMRLGGAMAVALANNAIEVRGQVHYAHIAETVVQGESASTAVMDQLAGLFEGRHGNSPTNEHAGISFVVATARREALIRAFNDITISVAALALLSLLLLPLYSTQKPARAPTPGAMTDRRRPDV